MRLAGVRVRPHRHDGAVSAKVPLSGPAAVPDCLSHYTQRTAIGNERLVSKADTRRGSPQAFERRSRQCERSLNLRRSHEASQEAPSK
jgi:hypothetical protein